MINASPKAAAFFNMSLTFLFGKLGLPPLWDGEGWRDRRYSGVWLLPPGYGRRKI